MYLPSPSCAKKVQVANFTLRLQLQKGDSDLTHVAPLAEPDVAALLGVPLLVAREHLPCEIEGGSKTALGGFKIQKIAREPETHSHLVGHLPRARPAEADVALVVGSLEEHQLDLAPSSTPICRFLAAKTKPALAPPKIHPHPPCLRPFPDGCSSEKE